MECRLRNQDLRNVSKRGELVCLDIRQPHDTLGVLEDEKSSKELTFGLHGTSWTCNDFVAYLGCVETNVEGGGVLDEWPRSDPPKG